MSRVTYSSAGRSAGRISLVGGTSKALTSLTSGSRHITRIDGYRFNSDSPASNITYDFPYHLESVTFKPKFANNNNLIDMSLVLDNIIGTVSQAIQAQRDTRNVTLIFETEAEILAGWQIVITRGSITMVLGEVISIDKSGSQVTLQVKAVCPINAVFTTPGTTNIRLAIPLMRNVSIVGTESIVYKADVHIGINEYLVVLHTLSTANVSNSVLSADVTLRYKL